MSRRHSILLGWLFIGITAFSRGMLPAQEIDDLSTSGIRSATGSSYSCITKSGDLTMMVNVWGYVRLPGRYEVSTSTDLVQLLSCAGGPNSEGTVSDVMIARMATVDGVETRNRFTVDLEDPDEFDEKELVLHPGDTIYIGRSDWASFKDILDVMMTAAVMTTAVASVIIAIED